LLLVFTFLTSLALRPALAYDSATQPLPFSVSTVYQAPPGCLPDTMIHITIATNAYVLRLLTDHRMFTDYTRHSLNMSRTDNACKLSFRILAGADDVSPNDPATYRQWIEDAQPGTQILKEFAADASGMKGFGFSFQWRRPDGLLESEQMVYVPCSAGILEFSATSLVYHADQAMTDLQLMLMAFRAPVNGKIEMPVRGNVS